MTTKEQILQLQNITKKIIEESEENFGGIKEDLFNHNLSPKSWSVAQCLNHLNRYSDFYHTQFKNALNADEKEEFVNSTEEIKYSWLTKNFLKYIKLNEEDQPKKKIKAPRKTFQVNSDFTMKEFEKFIENQKEMLSLLMVAEDKGAYRFKKIKTMFPILKMKCLDLMVINVHHNYRHFIQAKNTLEKIKIQSN